MRKAINENPVVQISVLGVGLILVGFLLFTGMSGGDTESEPVPANAPIGSTDADATGGTVPGGSLPSSTGGVDPVTTPPVGGETGSSTPPVTPSGSVDAQSMAQPGPGLPVELTTAWSRGDAIVLLVVRGGGIDDRLVRGSTNALSGDKNLAVFVTRAKGIASYSRVTQAVGLNRVPALVVIRPKDVAGAPPQAQVSYGFRSAQSVVQAVRDALYKGRDDVPYNPG